MNNSNRFFLVLLLSATIACGSLFGQSTAKMTTPTLLKDMTPKPTNDIGLNLLGLSNPFSPQHPMSDFLALNIIYQNGNSPRAAWRYGIAYGFSNYSHINRVTINDTATIYSTDQYKHHDFSLVIGRHFHRELTSRIAMYLNLDLNAGFSHFDYLPENWSSVRSDYTTIHFKFLPAAGLKYDLGKRLQLRTEVSWFMPRLDIRMSTYETVMPRSLDFHLTGNFQLNAGLAYKL